MQVLFTVSSVLGGVACVSSLLLLWVCLDSYNSNGFLAFPRPSPPCPTLRSSPPSTSRQAQVVHAVCSTMCFARSHARCCSIV